MVDLEHPEAEAGMRVSQRERIEPCPQDHNLANAARHRRIQAVFGKSAAGRHEDTHLPLGGIGRDRVDEGIRFGT